MYDPKDFKKYQFLDSIEGVPELEELKNQSLFVRVRNYFPGIMVCLVITLAAQFLSAHYTAPVMLMALLMGMSLNFLSQEAPTKLGVEYTSQSILRAGVVLIGARIVFEDFVALGAAGIGLVITATILVIIASLICTKALGLGKEQGLLIGGATAICGASAALAISSVLPKSDSLEQNTLLAVLGVTAMGTLAMIVYPVIIGFLGYDDHQAGLLIGGAIHDVSQVVGAGYSISTEAGDTAILIKLMRIFLLIPLLFVFAYAFKAKEQDATNKKLPIPLFLAGFFVLMVLNSFHLLPQNILDVLEYTSKWFLIMAITAVGMKTSLKAVFSLGWRPFVLIFVDTLFIALLYFLAIAFAIV
tara:strand:- start:1774 stop:2847 length:1074 start_codon:yes stop_codon:yes gene_type:complete